MSLGVLSVAESVDAGVRMEGEGIVVDAVGLKADPGAAPAAGPGIETIAGTGYDIETATGSDGISGKRGCGWIKMIRWTMDMIPDPDPDPVILWIPC